MDKHTNHCYCNAVCVEGRGEERRGEERRVEERRGEERRGEERRGEERRGEERRGEERRGEERRRKELKNSQQHADARVHGAGLVLAQPTSQNFSLYSTVHPSAASTKGQSVWRGALSRASPGKIPLSVEVAGAMRPNESKKDLQTAVGLTTSSLPATRQARILRHTCL